ncbi:hypothetical protein TanjilG_18931 [Lupinus angustifolius]|uniref:Uncharacterized protein n=1 Tax=Lupinus angustifolius TaxID=3871 RepID=A0A4P1RQM5_LUPAN|nr:PREDICTED: uncharacterized protein LOC109340620 [Lupinus angustifolius]OIW16216.1 hypothetical protein TanjilG_18931 [Lupinus angustifolius]
MASIESDPTRRVSSRKRIPFSDFTNTFTSNSHSSLSIKPSPSSPFNKNSTKRIVSTNTSTILDTPSNPNSPPSPILSTPPLKSSSLRGTGDFSIKYSLRRHSNQRKDKGNAVAIPLSRTPNLNISNSWETSDSVEGENVPKAITLTVPLRKKHRSVSSEQDVLKDPVLQDFIKKQRAYFKAIDEFKLSEEEVESGDELD